MEVNEGYKTAIKKNYFEWLYRIVCKPEETNFRLLLQQLFYAEFTWTIAGDENRAGDGLYLRYKFVGENHKYIEGPCSVLEMMVALAQRCENDIMDNTDYGDRTAQWFWQMVASLGLNGMTDDVITHYKELNKQNGIEYINAVIERFLKREYEKDGTGGLFRIPDTSEDMRKLEIWYQMCRYLNRIVS